jgi:hypothetical protein
MDPAEEVSNLRAAGVEAQEAYTTQTMVILGEGLGELGTGP